MHYDGQLPGEDEVTTTTTTTAAAAAAATATTATAKATTQLDITLVSPIMSLCVTRLLKCYCGFMNRCERIRSEGQLFQNWGVSPWNK